MLPHETYIYQGTKLVDRKPEAIPQEHFMSSNAKTDLSFWLRDDSPNHRLKFTRDHDCDRRAPYTSCIETSSTITEILQNNI